MRLFSLAENAVEAPEGPRGLCFSLPLCRRRAAALRLGCSGGSSNILKHERLLIHWRGRQLARFQSRGHVHLSPRPPAAEAAVVAVNGRIRQGNMRSRGLD